MRRAQHLPVRASHSSNIDMKLELLRLNPQLRHEMAERAAGLADGQLTPRDTKDDTRDAAAGAVSPYWI